MQVRKQKCLDCDGEGEIEVLVRNATERVLNLLINQGIANEVYVLHHANVKKRTLTILVNKGAIIRVNDKHPDASPMYKSAKIFTEDGSK